MHHLLLDPRVLYTVEVKLPKNRQITYDKVRYPDCRPVATVEEADGGIDVGGLANLVAKSARNRRQD